MQVKLEKSNKIPGAVNLFLDGVYSGTEKITYKLYERIFPNTPSNIINHLIEAPKNKGEITAADEALFSGSEFEDEGMGDLDTEGGGEIPTEFYFESFMVFISNLMSVPGAVADRVTCIRYVYTKEQAIDLIERSLNDLVPSLSLQKKQEVIKFMRTYVKHAPRISFRLFKMICSIYSSGNAEWKNWALLQMKNLPQA